MITPRLISKRGQICDYCWPVAAEDVTASDRREAQSANDCRIIGNRYALPSPNARYRNCEGVTMELAGGSSSTVPEFSPAPRTVAPKKSELPVLPDEDDVLEIIPASVFEPMPAESFVHKRIGGALRGFVTGGPVGAAAGFITGGGGAPRAQVVTDPCPGGFVLPGGKCFETPIVPQRAPVAPRGFSPTRLGGGGGVQVGTVSAGMFGALSTEPQEVQSFRLQCPRGLVLGKDERCYAKGTIPPKLRKWRPATRPPVTAGDARAVRRAAATKTRVKKLAKDVGLHVHVHHRATAAKKGKK